MGGKGGAKGSNDAVVQEQRAQADEARRKETERAARIQEGQAKIRASFEGSPIMGTRKAARTREVAAPPQNTWSPGADSQAYNASLGDQQFDPRYAQANPDAAQGVGITAAAPTTETYYEDESYDTGQKTGGFDDAFYDAYGNVVLKHYQPQVEKQYADAKKELTYRLGRSGNLRSQAAAEEVADLSTQYDLNTANVRTKADAAETDLRNTVSGQRAKIENALIASEDPTQAANQATAAVRDISLQQPDLSPLGAIFNVATVGGANFLRGAQNAKYANAFADGSLPRKASRIV